MSAIHARHGHARKCGAEYGLSLKAAFCLAVILAVMFGSPALAQDAHDAAFYPEHADASAVIDAALAQARDEGKQALIVFGADWCHDSRGLAETLDNDERLSTLIADHYVLVRVDVGQRHRNQDQLQRFGLEGTFGTPTLVIAEGEGQAVNGLTAHDWRTAHDAAPSDIAAYLSHYAQAEWDGSAVASADLAAVALGWPPFQDAVAEGSRRLAAGEITPDEAASLGVFIHGMARSIARLGMGREAEAQGVAIADLADLEAMGVRPSQDLTEAVTQRVSGIAFDLLARFEAQTEQTREALEAEHNAASDDMSTSPDHERE